MTALFRVYYIVCFPLTLLVCGSICVYKLTFSRLGKWCNAMPSCSSYGLRAVWDYGAVWGAVLAARRVLRCHNIKGTYDFVPANILSNFKWKC